MKCMFSTVFVVKGLLIVHPNQLLEHQTLKYSTSFIDISCQEVIGTFPSYAITVCASLPIECAT